MAMKSSRIETGSSHYESYKLLTIIFLLTLSECKLLTVYKKESGIKAMGR